VLSAQQSTEPCEAGSLLVNKLRELLLGEFGVRRQINTHGEAEHGLRGAIGRRCH